MQYTSVTACRQRRKIAFRELGETPSEPQTYDEKRHIAAQQRSAACGLGRRSSGLRPAVQDSAAAVCGLQFGTTQQRSAV